MATVENDILMEKKDKNGDTIIYYPGTRLKNVLDDSYNSLDTILESLTDKIDEAAEAAVQSFNPDFEGLIGRNGFKLAKTYSANKIVAAITYVPTNLLLATRTKTYNANGTITTETVFHARTIAIDGVTINTLAKTDKVTFSPSTMTTQ